MMWLGEWVFGSGVFVYYSLLTVTGCRQTEDLKSRTLNPEPRTLNPELRTLNPEPAFTANGCPLTVCCEISPRMLTIHNNREKRLIYKINRV